MELTVALDNDDVLINFIPTLVDKYNEKYGTNFTVENDVTDWKIDRTKFTHGLFQLLEDSNIILEMKIKSEIIKDTKNAKKLYFPFNFIFEAFSLLFVELENLSFFLILYSTKRIKNTKTSKIIAIFIAPPKSP